jgi:hypothetical protein
MKSITFQVEVDKLRQLVIVNIDGVLQGFHLTPQAAVALGFD